ncbi:CinA family nicotinamide mononucleotide deamidase-related protein [Aureispira sp. CCB-QB1]|uniref:CinA family nicotinamide mononucleotide deamidase-related protein n=1 Tax=Aureispira sp. CCB-QB1 TaxID=1313421 RepID=UPI000696B8B4|nr:CinA family nicotinamide mononucleotide deamidase-related protein [Aureispira sp. CCB-QB1]
MKATIINIGDEILIGQVVNTNAAWMAEKLNQNGIAVDRVLTIADTKEAIVDALDLAIARTDLVLITGGLGLTKDDITKRTLTDYFGMELKFHAPSFNNLQQLFAQFGRTPDDRYKVQAEMPDGAKVLINKVGAASGMWFERDGKVIVSMPGIPREVKYLMKYEVLPNLKMQFQFPSIMHYTVNVTGKGETDLAEMLTEFEQKLPSNIKLAYLPNSMIGVVRLRLSAYGEDVMVLETQLDHYIRKLPPVLGSLIYGEHKDTLERVIGQMLLKRKYTLGTAESCTGGNIAHKITSVAGCSAYYESSVIAYSNAVKRDLLGVKQETLDEHGAVSEQTVIEMARGTQKLLNVNCAIAVSGVAGPTGGSPEKPVGTIWVAVTENERIYTQKLQLGKDRLQNIERTTTIALNLLRRFLLDDLSNEAE